MHTPAQASVDPTIGNTEFLTPWKHPQRSTEHDTGQAAPIASEHSSSLGSSLAAPAIHEPPPSLALHRPKNVRKAKSFHSLATHKNQKASQSSPELPRSRVASQENIPLPPQQQHRERKVSGLGLNLSWVGLGRPSTDNSTTSSRSSSDSRPSLSSRKSFSFLRGSSGPKATTAPVRPQVSGKHLSPSNFTASEKRSASPEPPLPPSLPAVNVDPTFDWDLSHRKSSSRDAMTNKPGSFFLTRSRSSSMGKLLRDAVTSSSTVSPGSTSPASQTRAASPASQNEDPVMSRSGSRSNAPRLSRLPTPTLDSAPHSPASIPSSPLVHSSDQMSHTEPNIQYKDRALTFALPHASEPHDAPQAIPRPQSSSGTSDGTRQSRRSSVASAFQAINPFHHHGHNSSRPCLFSDTEGRVLDSPSEEPDLASLLSHSVTDSVTLKERDLAGAIPQEDRKRSGSLASSSGGGWRSTVFGRRRASSLALNNQATETLHIPTAEDSTRPSISSVTSFSSNRSDPYNTSPNRWAASASTSTLPSASSSRKPSMIFSKAPTRSSFSSHPSPTLPQQSTPPKDEKPPKIEEDDTPESYLERLEENCAKAQIAKLLSSSSEPFYAEALRLYMGRFTFKDIAIDIALRKLLMELFLPRETQQIDRVMETFATHYQAQNPDVFTSTGTSALF